MGKQAEKPAISHDEFQGDSTQARKPWKSPAVIVGTPVEEETESGGANTADAAGNS